MDLLPESERLVIKHHYLENHSFTDIAKKLKLTKARVSQLHKSGLSTLRKKRKSRESLDVRSE